MKKTNIYFIHNKATDIGRQKKDLKERDWHKSCLHYVKAIKTRVDRVKERFVAFYPIHSVLPVTINI